MVSLKIEVKKRDITWVVLLGVVLLVSVAYAYGSSSPSVMGHSAGEIEVNDAFCNQIIGQNCGKIEVDNALCNEITGNNCGESGDVVIDNAFCNQITGQDCGTISTDVSLNHNSCYWTASSGGHSGTTGRVYSSTCPVGYYMAGFRVTFWSYEYAPYNHAVYCCKP